MEYKCSSHMESRKDAQTDFLDNVSNGYVKKVEDLLKGGFSAQTCYNEWCQHVLHATVNYYFKTCDSEKKCNYLKIAELLLDYGCDVNKYDTFLGTPLHLALSAGALRMVQVLLKIENKCREKNEELSIENFMEQSQNVIDFLLKKGNTYEITEDKYPILLDFAAKTGDEKSFKKILMTLGSIQSAYNYVSKSTVFHTVVYNEVTCKMIKDLVDHGAAINEIDNDGNTPLHTAMKLRRFHHVRCLLECNASVYSLNNAGKSILHVAAETRADEDIIQTILSKGIDVDIKSRIFEATPLHLACKQDVETVQKFVNNGANINAKNCYGNTPLQEACNVYNFTIVSYLIKAGADVNCTNDQKLNSLHLSIMQKNRDVNINIVKLLLDQGIDVNCRDYWGRTALHYIANQKIPRADRGADLRCLKMLIKEGADVNSKDKEGNTPLHYMLTSPYPQKFIQYLVELADFNAQNMYRETPLCYGIHKYNNIGYLTFNMRYLIAHLSKMMVLKLHVCEKNLQALNDEKTIKFYRECNADIYKMKTKIRNSNISMLDFFCKDVNKLAAFLRNEDILEALDQYSFSNNFPVYGTLLKRKMKRAIKRLGLLRSYEYIFNCHLKAKLPNLVLNKIGGYLRIGDLKTFVKTFGLHKKTIRK